MSDIELYKNSALNLLHKKSNKVFSACSTDESDVVVELLMEHSENSLIVFTNSLFSDELNKKLFYCVEKIQKNNGRVRIVIINPQKNDKSIQDFFSPLLKKFKGTLECRYANYDSKKPLPYFIISDKKRYKLENVHFSTIASEVCFNGKIKPINYFHFLKIFGLKH